MRPHSAGAPASSSAVPTATAASGSGSGGRTAPTTSSPGSSLSTADHRLVHPARQVRVRGRGGPRRVTVGRLGARARARGPLRGRRRRRVVRVHRLERPQARAPDRSRELPRDLAGPRGAGRARAHARARVRVRRRANAIGLTLAVALNRTLKSRNFIRALFFAPVVMSPLAVSFIWQFVFDYRGR